MATFRRQPGVNIARPLDRWQWLGLLYLTIGMALLLLWLAELTGMMAGEPDMRGGTVILLFSGLFLLSRDPQASAGVLGQRRWWPLLGAVGLALLAWETFG